MALAVCVPCGGSSAGTEQGGGGGSASSHRVPAKPEYPNVTSSVVGEMAVGIFK